MENLITLALGTAILAGFAIYADRHRDDSDTHPEKGSSEATFSESVPVAVPAPNALSEGGAIPTEHVQMSRGLPVEWLASVADALRWEVGLLSEALAINPPCGPPQDFVRRLTIDESARLLAVAGLITLVNEMVTRSGNVKGFRASHWLGDWLQQPCPAYGWKRPMEYLGSSEGLQFVEQTLMQMESGAYA